MIYEVCEALREQIMNMNEMILKKLRELTEVNSIDNALKATKFSNEAPLTFTPVNSETFAKWCDMYKEKMRIIKEEMRTDRDLKLTGKQLFETRKGILEDFKIEDEEDDEEFKDDEGGVPDDEEDEEDAEKGVAFYDKALYEADLEEDVEFD